MRVRRCAARWGGTAALALATLAGAAPSYAQAPPAEPGLAPSGEAKTRFDRAVGLFNDGDFTAALIEFRRAYDLAPNWRVFYNIGKVQTQLQQYPEAIRTYERYLAEGGKAVPAKKRQEVERDIPRLRERVAKLTIETNAHGASIQVDDVPAGTTPLSEPVLVSAGRRRVVATLAGRGTVAKTVEVAGGDAISVTLELPDAPAGAALAPISPAGTAQDHEGSGSRRPLLIGMWVGTGAFAVATIVAGVLAVGASSDRSAMKDTFGVASADLAAAQSKVSTLALVTDILGGATILAGGVAIYLTATSGSSTASPKRGGVGLSAGPGGIFATGAF